MKRFIVFAIVASLFITSTVFAQTPYRAEDVGLTRVIADSVAWDVGVDNQSNWEGYASKLGDGTLLLVVNTYPEGEEGVGGEVAAIVAVNPDGTYNEYWGFYADDGSPYKGNMDIIRTDGNPPSIAGDKRPGSNKYIVANESTPMDFGAFQSDGRWDGNDYVDHIFAAQILELTDNGPVKITNVFDPIYGEQTGVSVGKIRKGGTIGLSNGNFVIVGEDRTRSREPMGSIIDGNTGAIIKGPYNLGGEGTEFSTWESLAAFEGGFAFRLSPQRNGDKGNHIRFFDNDGNFLGEWLQISVDIDDFSGLSLDLTNNPNGYTTTINEDNRGDHQSIRGNIDSNTIYFAGAGWDDIAVDPQGWPYLITIDATTFETTAEIRVNELELDGGEFNNFARVERMAMDIDEKGNVVVVWSDTSNSETGNGQLVARIFNSDLEPVTPSFLVFQNSDIGFGTADGEITGIQSFHPDVAMTNDLILISARTQDFPIDGEIQPISTHIFTVLENPLKDSAVKEWSIF